MLLPKILNTVGLGLGAIGVVLIFVWGPPQPDFQDYVGLSVGENTVLTDGRRVGDMLSETERMKQQYRLMSRIGLGLIFIGFAVQLVAVWE